MLLVVAGQTFQSGMCFGAGECCDWSFCLGFSLLDCWLVSHHVALLLFFAADGCKRRAAPVQWMYSLGVAAS